MAPPPSPAEQALDILQSIGDLPSAIKDFILANPGLSAAQLILLLPLICPAFIAGPALLSLGFSGTGPVAGSAAAAFQAAHGTPAIFSALQSAAMGGYGAPVVHGIVQGTSIVGGVLTGLFKRPQLAPISRMAKAKAAAAGFFGFLK